MERPFKSAILQPRSSGREMLGNLLAQADIRLNGSRPWDVQLHDESVIDQVLAYGSLGLGEAYMRGAWEAEALDETVCRLLRARVDQAIHPMRLLWFALQARLLNRQSRRRAWQVGQVHYDLGNAFYQSFLGRTMAYTCGYWTNAADLDTAQEAKLDLICRKLDLQPGQRVLDIGCGWGSFMKYASEHYGVECVGVTISREQVALGKQLCAGLPVSFRLQDYRDIEGSFDHVVSIGMFEHVGRRNYPEFMEVVRHNLRPGGLFLLHTIGKLRSDSLPDPWLDKYIFPNGELPAMAWIEAASEGRFVTEDVHNFGADYDRTLMAWYQNFEAAWPRLQDNSVRDGLDERFYRLWRYYLLSCAGTFRARVTQLWQFVFSREGVPGGYRRVS